MRRRAEYTCLIRLSVVQWTRWLGGESREASTLVSGTDYRKRNCDRPLLLSVSRIKNNTPKHLSPSIFQSLHSDFSFESHTESTTPLANPLAAS